MMKRLFIVSALVVCRAGTELLTEYRYDQKLLIRVSSTTICG
jgi:hypothetical protein